MKITRSSHNQFFEPNKNKVASLADLMSLVEPHVVAETNRYLAKWRETGKAPAPMPKKEDIGLPFGSEGAEAP